MSDDAYLTVIKETVIEMLIISLSSSLSSPTHFSSDVGYPMGYRPGEPESQFHGRWSVLWKAHRCTFIHSRAHKIKLYSDRYKAKSIERKTKDIVRLFLYISLFLI